MNIFKFLFTLLLITSCGTDDMDIPTPKKIPYEIINHNDIRIDNYYWLRDDTRSNEEILTYLLSEINMRINGLVLNITIKLNC